MSIDALLFTHGAGSDRTHPTGIAIEKALAPIPVERVDFPYRKEGRKAPDRAPKLLSSLAADTAALLARTGADPFRVAFGGRSMGGRICSMAVAEGMPAAGLILISYPLHPVGKPDRLRVEHFAAITVPCLFISGTRDPFGTPDEFGEHLGAISGPVTQVWLDGQRHDIKGHDDLIVDAVLSFIETLPSTPALGVG